MRNKLKTIKQFYGKRPVLTVYIMFIIGMVVIRVLGSKIVVFSKEFIIMGERTCENVWLMYCSVMLSWLVVAAIHLIRYHFDEGNNYRCGLWGIYAVTHTLTALIIIYDCYHRLFIR